MFYLILSRLNVFDRANILIKLAQELVWTTWGGGLWDDAPLRSGGLRAGPPVGQTHGGSIPVGYTLGSPKNGTLAIGVIDFYEMFCDVVARMISFYFTASKRTSFKIQSLVIQWPVTPNMDLQLGDVHRSEVKLSFFPSLISSLILVFASENIVITWAAMQSALGRFSLTFGFINWSNVRKASFSTISNGRLASIINFAIKFFKVSPTDSFMKIIRILAWFKSLQFKSSLRSINSISKY